MANHECENAPTFWDVPVYCRGFLSAAHPEHVLSYRLEAGGVAAAGAASG
jgi:hypothetical protein